MDKQQLLFYFTLVSSSLCLLPFIISLINFGKINLILKPIFWLVVINVVVEIVNYVHVFFNQTNNYLFQYYTIVEFALISLFYSFFFKNYFKPIFINFLIPLFFIAAFIDYKVYSNYSMYNFSPSVECIMLIFYSLYFIYYILNNLIFDNLLKEPVFWVNTAILFYFSGNLILFIFSNYIAKSDPSGYSVLWSVIHTFFNILFNVILTVGFWKTKNK